MDPRPLAWHLAWAYVVACARVEQAPETSAEVGTPDVALSPAAVYLDGVCGEIDSRVTIRNTGTAPLAVRALELSGTGWALGEVALPASVAPEATLEVPMRATFGEAALTVRTDDPERPEIVVPLRARADVPPRVAFVSPSEESALGATDDVTLVAFVGDEEQPAESLLVRWTNTLTGNTVGSELGTSAPDAAGRVSFLWAAVDRPTGPLVVQATVEDTCGNVGEASVHVCQDGAWIVPALTYDAWITAGDAAVAAGTCTLGPGDAASFDATTTFNGDRLEVSVGLAGTGDAIALVARDGARTADWGGGDLGFAALPGWAVLLDARLDGEDPCGIAPAVAWIVDGDLGEPAACAPMPELADGTAHRLAVALEGGRAEVRLDDTVVLEGPAFGAWPGEAFLGVAGRGSWTVEGLEAVDYTCPR